MSTSDETATYKIRYQKRYKSTSSTTVVTTVEQTPIVPIGTLKTVMTEEETTYTHFRFKAIVKTLFTPVVEAPAVAAEIVQTITETTWSRHHVKHTLTAYVTADDESPAVATNTATNVDTTYYPGASFKTTTRDAHGVYRRHSVRHYYTPY